MKKSDLKTGMKVVTRDGSVYIVLMNAKTDYTDQYKTYNNMEGILVNPKEKSYSWTSLNSYDDDLNKVVEDQEIWDIVEISVPGHPYDVFYPNSGYRVIWTREDKTESEKQLDAVMQKLAELQKEAEQLQETIKKEKK